MRTLLVGAGAHTLDHGGVGPAPRALLLDGEMIAWVGADPAEAPAHDRAVDLGGAWMTPAFVDAHVHATATGLALRGIDLDGVDSAAQALDRLRRHAAGTDDPVIIGVRWDDLRWPEGRPMTAAQVSAAAPGRTVLLNRVDAHSCVVDAATLARLPLDRLEGVDRDPTGDPTGWLIEAASQAARAAVYGSLPAPQLAAARDAVCGRAAELGIGSLHEMGHPGLSSLEDARTWERGSWPIEVLVWWAELDPVVSQENGLRPGGDLFLDGSIGSRTAAVSFGYRGDGGNGTLFHDDQEVAAFFSDCTASGRAAGVHAIGDRAIEQAVVALETAATRHGLDAVRRCRHRIEHVELPRDDHIARLAALGVVASVQPVFDALWGGEGQLYEERFGANVALASNPFGRLHGAGIPLAFGSDSTVTPLDPWGAVHAAEHHRGGFGVDRSTALEAHVNGGRLAAGQPRGVLRAGEPADLTVWDRDPLTVADPRSLRCLATLVGGRSAHGDLVVA